MWHHVEQDEECFHCLFENWMKDDPGMSDLLSCPLSDEVRSSVVSYSLFALGYSHCTTTSCLLCSQESQQVIGLWFMNVVYVVDPINWEQPSYAHTKQQQSAQRQELKYHLGSQ